MNESPGLSPVHSFETHAKTSGRYHPFLLKFTLSLFKEAPGLRDILFHSERDCTLFFQALKNARVHVLKGKQIASGRRAPGNRKEPCRVYYRRFPREFSRFFHSRKEMVRFLIETTSRFEARERARERESRTPITGKTTSTPCFMLANHAFWSSGVLNKPGRHSGNTFDLSTREGYVFILHEVFHTMQWYRAPIRFIFKYLKALVRSLAMSDGHIPWAHEVIDFEMEAIVFHTKLWMFLDDNPGMIAKLLEFKEYQ
ncbi:MAG: hypothetical protein ACTSUE_13130 [Promethearchaeota archaeon]